MCAVALCAAGTPGARAQQPETTRHLWDTGYIEQANKPARKPAARRYRVATPQVPVAGVAADAVVGVTLWRLRPSRAADTGERMIVHEGPETAEWLPERVASGRTLAEGDRIRMSIEAARTGYLYVVDREEYADGSLGEPMLIFPTTRTHGGDNSVAEGRVVEIPAQDDAPPYFTLKRSRADLVGENVIVLVSPSPVEGLTITDKAQKIPAETLASWEKSWGTQTGRLEMAGGEGRPWTRAEREAGADGTRALKSDEPAPQTLYYRPGTDGKTPVLITVQVRYGGPAPRAKRGR
jgi:hypothetical protein